MDKIANDVEVVTFGCRLNTYESQVIKQNAANEKLKNVIVFNTCAVTAEATRQAKQAIRKARKNNPDSKIIVTGCAVQYSPEEFTDMPEIDQVLGNEEKLNPASYRLDAPKILINDIMSVRNTAEHMITAYHEQTRAFLQIQNGCNHRCTFCMIPLARGNSRSVPIGQISSNIAYLIAKGYQEVVFTGVDITEYGSDLPGTPTIAQMIKRILNLNPQLKRLRLSSIDVAEIDDELFELMAYEPRLMPHYHISLQAGDNMILKRMKRRHTREQVVDFCHRLREIRGNVSYGADIIAGFPTETDEMFNNTKNLISEAGLQFLHIFPYSERSGTPAARMPQVEKNLRKMRAKILRDEGKKELSKFLNKHVGSKAIVLTEDGSIGHTDNFIKVKLSSEKPSNILLEVDLSKVEGDLMLAEVA
ncbi:tRNA (N(6)-L-threonylcarbamoyladenosine(37)-C(2))-methylthiotransferase MtaB [Candidatus Phycorickettsia trachydisci]|nr:tRNA (N(6)-L-threonylcarbamoyladenosine(37)-C(2))-methylthiotransferase MtaB [Candidatus Phycorickettsia trachydisci]